MMRWFIFLAIVPYAFGSLEIAGGNDTDISLYPWQISLQFLGSHFCGGFLVSKTWVVTAAHCIVKGYSAGLNIRTGSTYKSSGGQTITVSDYVLHPQYNSTSDDFDIALLALDEDVTIESSAPAKLPDDGAAIPAGVSVTLTGWGRKGENRDFSETLQEVQVPSVPQEECRAAYGESKITDNMFCAGYLGLGGKDSCGGDSGGPAILNGLVVGVVSFGKECASSVWPGVYTKTSNSRDWIRRTTGF
ncbi:hypothetical protein JTB14_025065 [Gonioctena quinquepunctata]|nr:hypothetical protein JTB14_025065 [Gonioctena quinquepunctata]